MASLLPQAQEGIDAFMAAYGHISPQPGPAASQQPAAPAIDAAPQPPAIPAANEPIATNPAEPQAAPATPAATQADPALPATPAADPFANIVLDDDPAVAAPPSGQSAALAPNVIPAAALSQLSADAGESFAAQADVAVRIKALKEENAALKAAPQYADPRLAAADRAARMGIDPLAYLKVAETDPITGLSDEQIVAGDFRLAQPNATPDEISEYLEQLGPGVIKMQAVRLRNDYAGYRQAQVAQMEREAIANKAADNARFRAAASQMKDWHGIPVTAQQQQDITNTYESGQLASLFAGPDGQPDPALIAQAIYVAKYGARTIAAIKKTLVASTKEEVYRAATNASSPLQQGVALPPQATQLSREQVQQNYAERAAGGAGWAMPRA